MITAASGVDYLEVPYVALRCFESALRLVINFLSSASYFLNKKQTPPPNTHTHTHTQRKKRKAHTHQYHHQKIEELQKYAKKTKKTTQTKSQKVSRSFTRLLCVSCTTVALIHNLLAYIYARLQYQWKVEAQRLHKRQNV